MEKKKSIAIIGTAGVPAKYGGFETLAHNLVNELNDEFDIHVYASKKIYPANERPKFWNKARVHYFGLSANGVSSIPYDFITMLHACRYADTLIVLGVSGGVFIPLIKLISKCKVIVNIDGLEWRRDKWAKPIKWFLKVSEWLAVRFSDADITDNLSIKRYTSIKYKTVSHMIAYGADHAQPEKISGEMANKYPFLDSDYAFKVARIEPENNLEMIVEAFSKMPRKKLVVVGNWNSSEFGTQLREAYKAYDNLHLLDPIYNQEELNVLRSNCKLYVHGHSAGGTNPSLVEAMILQLPILSFDVSFNRATTHNQALFFKNYLGLIDLVQSTNDDTLLQVAQKMKAIALQNYTWKQVANRYRGLVLGFDYNYKKSKFKRKSAKVSYSKMLKTGHAHLQNVQLNFDELKDIK